MIVVELTAITLIRLAWASMKPLANPIPAIMSPTSPRGIMPTPTVSASREVYLESSNAPPHPSTLRRTAKDVISNPGTRLETNALGSINMPIDTKKWVRRRERSAAGS